MTHNTIPNVDYAPLLAALSQKDGAKIDAAYAEIRRQFAARDTPVREDPDGFGGDWPAPSEEALEWARDFNAAMEKKDA